MAKVVLNPFRDGRPLVTVETKESITEIETQEISYALLRVYMRELSFNCLPSVQALKDAVSEYNPELAKKITGKELCWFKAKKDA